MMIHSLLFFCPVFNPPHRNTVWIGVVVCRLGSKCPLLWLANSSVCLAVYVLHRWTLLWFRLNMHKYLSNYLFNRQNNSDHVKQPYSQLCVATLLNLLIKCSEQGRGLTHTVYRYSLKIKFIHSFLTLGSEGRQCKASCLRTIFIVWFLYRPVFASLVNYMCESVDGAKQAAM